MEEKEYTVIPEGNEMIKQLAERYDKIFWAVKPAEVVVLGITNKEAPKNSRTKAKITKVTPIYRALLSSKGCPEVKYMIEVYCSEWQGWGPTRRQWVLAHEITHIPGPNATGLIKHDVEDFSAIVDKVGTNWFDRKDLPDLLIGEKFEFDENSFSKLHLDS